MIIELIDRLKIQQQSEFRENLLDWTLVILAAIYVRLVKGEKERDVVKCLSICQGENEKFNSLDFGRLVGLILPNQKVVP